MNFTFMLANIVFARFVLSFTVKRLKSKANHLKCTVINYERKSIDFNLSNIEEYANCRNLKLNIVDRGVLLHVEAYSLDTALFGSSPVGYLTAYIRPFGLLHLDSIKVQNRRQSNRTQRKSWTTSGPGISFILGSCAICWGYDKECRRAELLAVKDTSRMNRVLCRLYESFGFRAVREVGDNIMSTMDRLVWGAVGTLMELDMDEFYTNWTPKFQEMITQANAIQKY